MGALMGSGESTEAMPRIAKVLSAKGVEKIKTPGLHAVGGVPGLALQVAPPQSRSWILRFSLDGCRRDLGLGSFSEVTLEEAREAAFEARKLIRQGLNPIAQRAKRIPAPESRSFKVAAAAFIASKRDGWKNAKHAEQWTSVLETYAYPIIGKLDVGEVDTAAILRVLQQDYERPGASAPQPLWTAIPETASRLRGRIEAVLDAARVGGHRTGDNPARWKGHLEHILPAKSSLPRGKERHHPALPYDDAPAFMQHLRSAEGTGARALEFAILTAARSGQVRGASWSEVDLEKGVWTIPANRMKAEREHRVPLPAAGLELLRNLPKIGGTSLMFPAPRGGPLSDMTLAAVIKRMNEGRAGVRWKDNEGRPAVPHGFRSTFKDWCTERTNYPNELSELALAHQVPDKVEAAYRRGDMFEKRRRMMDAWAAFLAKQPATNITPLRKSA